eukprot:8127227-Pyramimonas_sp.AAC.1
MAPPPETLAIDHGIALARRRWLGGLSGASWGQFGRFLGAVWGPFFVCASLALGGLLRASWGLLGATLELPRIF